MGVVVVGVIERGWHIAGDGEAGGNVLMFVGGITLGSMNDQFMRRRRNTRCRAIDL